MTGYISTKSDHAMKDAFHAHSMNHVGWSQELHENRKGKCGFFGGYLSPD
jgi:hypothetical protein